jgi:hypothetical protein
MQQQQQQQRITLQVVAFLQALYHQSPLLSGTALQAPQRMAGRHPLQQEQQQLAQLQQRLKLLSWVCRQWLYLLQLQLHQQLQAMLCLAGKLGVCGALQHCSSSSRSSSSKRQLPVLQARPD